MYDKQLAGQKNGLTSFDRECLRTHAATFPHSSMSFSKITAIRSLAPLL